MEYNHKDFFRWLEKSKATELDIIKCRKMQSPSFSETSNIYGIRSIQICGFINNDLVKLGGEIKQQYDESEAAYYKRVYDIVNVCCVLMDSVNEILVDEGSWSKGFFQKKLQEWLKDKLKQD